MSSFFKKISTATRFLGQLFAPHRLKWRDPLKDQVFQWSERKELMQFCLDNPDAVFDVFGGCGRVILVGDFMERGFRENRGGLADLPFPVSYFVERQKLAKQIYRKGNSIFND